MDYLSFLRLDKMADECDECDVFDEVLAKE
jgi:hypothetical protein